MIFDRKKVYQQEHGLVMKTEYPLTGVEHHGRDSYL